MAIHQSAAAGFTATTAATYDRGRPDWPRTIIADILRLLRVDEEPAFGGMFPQRPLLEIGAGTGKTTVVIHAILAEMAAARSGSRPNLLIVEPSGFGTVVESALGLPVIATTADTMPMIADGSVSSVVIAQAFHWFGNDRSLREIHRVLAPAGRCALVWNTRDTSAAPAKVMEDILDEYLEPGTPQHRTGEWRAAVAAAVEAGLFRIVTQTRLDHPGGGLHRSADQFVDWVLSISYIAKRGEAEKAVIADKCRAALATLPAAADGTYMVQLYTDVNILERVG